MALNWPPPTAPAWPPFQLSASWLSCSNWQTLAETMLAYGFSHGAPTPAERTAYFNPAQCSDGHNVLGRMLVSPDSLIRWPFCVCNNSQHRELLVLWPPYTAGSLAGPVSF